MSRPLALTFLAASFGTLTMLAAIACDSSSNPTDTTSPQPDSSTPAPQDAGVTVLPDGNVVLNDSAPPTPDCFMDAHTHFEIINACTDAQKIDKHPNLPLLLPDGGLPPPP
jgi:hypothetical protein